MTKKILAATIYSVVENGNYSGLSEDEIVEQIESLLDTLRPANYATFCKWGTPEQQSTPAECWIVPYNKMTIEEQVFFDINADNLDIQQHNDAILNELCKTPEDFLAFQDMIEGVVLIDKMEFCEGPSGDVQYEEYGIFKNVCVDQWTNGPSGDSFAGYIFAQVGERWLKIPYKC